jgi:benzoyl-CoA 2,3-dioxygenase component A
MVRLIMSKIRLLHLGARADLLGRSCFENLAIDHYGDDIRNRKHGVHVVLDAGSNIIMICTGTGSAPMRAMTERRRRRIAFKEGGELMLFFGGRSPGELPYFGPLMKLPKEFIDINLGFSRVPDRPKQYVQDLIRVRANDVARLLKNENTYIYICGLKGMETGVNDALKVACEQQGLNWEQLRPQLRSEGRYHVETY